MVCGVLLQLGQITVCSVFLCIQCIVMKGNAIKFCFITFEIAMSIWLQSICIDIIITTITADWEIVFYNDMFGAKDRERHTEV